jgi:hypothetical protein
MNLPLLMMELVTALNAALLAPALLCLPRPRKTWIVVLAVLTGCFGCSLRWRCSAYPSEAGAALGANLSHPVSVCRDRHSRVREALSGRSMALALGAALLFVLPFVLWAAGIIPYGIAKAFALILVAAVLGGVGWTLRHHRLTAPPDSDLPAQAV